MNAKLFFTAVALVGSVGALACSDKSDVNTSPDYVRGGAGFVCDFNVTKSDARGYVPSSLQTQAQAALRTMSAAYTAGDKAQTTTLGFDFMRDYIAAVHDANTAIGTPEVGSKLTNDLIACMDVGISDTVNFSGALGTVGGYQVRGGTGDATTPVTSLPKKAGLMPPSGTDYKTWVGERVLFYGAPKSNTFILNETPVKTVGFSWSTIPEDHSFTIAGLVGMCVGATDADRIQEVNGTSGKILPLQTSISALGLVDCATAPLAVASRSGVLNRLAQFALAAITPTPAYAAQDGGGTGGTVNGLSDFGVVNIVSVSLTMDSVKDAFTTDTIPTFHVTAKSAGGSLLPSVLVTLAVSGNNGSFTLSPTTPTATTDASGVATFTGVNLNKAGGYIITASSSTVGIQTTATVNSNMFHIKQ
jgi:hypothetical protein